MKHVRFSIKLQMVLLCSLLLPACNKYLDVTPKGYTLLTTVSNYDQWLNAPSLWQVNTYLTYPSDLLDQVSVPVPPSTTYDLAYVWAPQYNALGPADLWGAHYAMISSYNSVVGGIDKATGGSEQQKKSLKAEALLGRAYEYLYLINEYGKSYDSATADKDPGVPLIVSDDVAQDVPPRSTVKEVYDFIIADIHAAIPYLPVANSQNRYRGSVAAAYSVMARVYLYAHNYSKAQENAALALQHSQDRDIIDYTSMTSPAAIPALPIRPDAIYARFAGVTIRPVLEHLKQFDIHDSRLNLFYFPLGDYSFTQRGLVRFSFVGLSGTSNYDNAGTSVQEMKLIIAEAAARHNELPVALQQLEEVRKKRIPAAYYTPYQSNDPEFVLQKVLDERRFEFPFNGLRWLDMRRLDAEGRMPAVNRYDEQGNIIATLAPHSPRYVLQIPDLVLQYNPGMQQNP